MVLGGGHKREEKEAEELGKKTLRIGIFCISVETSASFKADGEEPSKVVVIFFGRGNFLPKKMHRTNQKPESVVARPFQLIQVVLPSILPG